MQHETSEHGGALVIAFSGDIDLQTSPDARKALLAEVGKGPPILVDLWSWVYRLSSGWRLWLNVYKAPRNQDKSSLLFL